MTMKERNKRGTAQKGTDPILSLSFSIKYPRYLPVQMNIAEIKDAPSPHPQSPPPTSQTSVEIDIVGDLQDMQPRLKLVAAPLSRPFHVIH